MYGPYQRIVLPDGSTLLVGAINQQGWDGYLNQSHYQAATVYGTPPLVTVSAAIGTITIEAPVEQTVLVQVAGFGGAASQVTGIIAPAEFINKFLMLRMAGAGAITYVNGAGLRLGANFTEDTVEDLLLVLCTAVNTFVQCWRSNNL